MPQPLERTLGFVLTLDGERRINRKLAIFNKKVLDFTVPFKKMKEDWYEKQEKMFAGEGKIVGEGRPYNKRWQDLNEEYLEWKKKKGYSTRILVRTGQMMAQLTDRNRAIITKDKLEIKASDIKVGKWNLARLHKYGTRRMLATRGMPARDPFELTAQQKERWIQIVRNWLREEK